MTDPVPAQQLSKGSQNLPMSAVFQQSHSSLLKMKIMNMKMLVEMTWEWTGEAVMMTTGRMVMLVRV